MVGLLVRNTDMSLPGSSLTYTTVFHVVLLDFEAIFYIFQCGGFCFCYDLMIYVWCISFSGGQDVDLDAILGELCELETQLTTQQTELNDSLHKAASSTGAKYAVVQKDSKRKQSTHSSCQYCKQSE